MKKDIQPEIVERLGVRGASRRHASWGGLWHQGLSQHLPEAGSRNIPERCCQQGQTLLPAFMLPRALAPRTDGRKWHWFTGKDPGILLDTK